MRGGGRGREVGELVVGAPGLEPGTTRRRFRNPDELRRSRSRSDEPATIWMPAIYGLRVVDIAAGASVRVDTVRRIDRLDVENLRLASSVRVAHAVGVAPTEQVPGLARRPPRGGLPSARGDERNTVRRAEQQRYKPLPTVSSASSGPGRLEADRKAGGDEPVGRGFVEAAAARDVDLEPLPGDQPGEAAVHGVLVGHAARLDRSGYSTNAPIVGVICQSRDACGPNSKMRRGSSLPWVGAEKRVLTTRAASSVSCHW